MKSIFDSSIGLFISLIVWSMDSKGQAIQSSAKDTSVVVADGPYVYVDSMPSLLGDQNLSNAKKEIKIRNAIQKSLVYPANFKPLNKSTKIFVRFIVAPDGRITDIVPIAAFDKRLDKACLDATATAVRALGNLNPGLQKGRPVPVGITTGIEFGKLSN